MPDEFDGVFRLSLRRRPGPDLADATTSGPAVRANDEERAPRRAGVNLRRGDNATTPGARVRGDDRARWLLALLLLAVVLFHPAHAKDAAPEAADPALEARMVRIASELRCLVCQNQTIADSHADLAVDLRRQVREQLQAGRSDAEIVDYMTARYGDFVLYRPPFKATTAFLWLGPALMLVGGGIALVVILRRRRRLPDDAFDVDDDGPADRIEHRDVGHA